MKVPLKPVVKRLHGAARALALLICAAAAPAAVAANAPRAWDFTAGTPDGGRLQAAARIDGGLVAGMPGDTSDRGGFVLDGVFTPQGAFLF